MQYQYWQSGFTQGAESLVKQHADSSVPDNDPSLIRTRGLEPKPRFWRFV